MYFLVLLYYMSSTQLTVESMPRPALTFTSQPYESWTSVCELQPLSLQKNRHGEFTRKAVSIDGLPVLFSFVLTVSQQANTSWAWLPKSEMPITGSLPQTLSLERWLSDVFDDVQQPVVVPAPSTMAWFPHQQGLIKVKLTTYRTGAFSYWHVWSRGEQVYLVRPRQLRNVNVGKVFLPNPIVSSGGQDLRDQDDQDNAVAIGFYDDVALLALTENQPVLINGAFSQSQDLSAPHGELANSSDNFLFTRSNPWFEEINIYHHIHRAQSYLQAIGITELQNRPIPFDAHGLDGADASQFSVWSDPAGSLEFGDGGVDDAEDADVIYHEYFHALHFAIAGDLLFDASFNLQLPVHQRTNEAGAIAEGCADYFTHSLTRELKAANDTDIYALMQWNAAGQHPEDGPPFYVRRCDVEGIYPTAITGARHQDGQLISSTLVDIRQQIGQQDTDELLMLALSILAPRPLFRDLAIAIMEADDFIFDGTHFDQISNAFSARGIYEPYVRYAHFPTAGKPSFDLVNTQLESAVIRLHGFDQMGNLIEIRDVELRAKASETLDPMNIFQSEDIRTLRLSSAQSFAGFVTVRSLDDQTSYAYPFLQREPFLELPHIAANTVVWTTEAEIQDLSPLPQNLQLNPSEAIYDSHAYRNLISMNLDDLAASGTTQGTLFGSGDLTGFERFQRVDGAFQTAALPLASSSRIRLIIPHVAADTNTFWTGIAFVNRGISVANVTVQFRGPSGESLQISALTLAANSKWLGLAEDLVVGGIPVATSHIDISSDQPLIGYELFGTQNGLSLAGLNVGESTSRTALTGINVDEQHWSGIAIVNTANAEDTIHLQAYGENGIALGEVSWTIPANGKRIGVIESIFNPASAPFIRWIEASATVPFTAFVLRGDLPERRYMDGIESQPILHP